MESGKHRMSLKLMEGEGSSLNHYFGLVRDGAAWEKFHAVTESTDAWYMEDSGDLCGNGKEDDDDAGLVCDSSIVALCVDFSAALDEWDSLHLL
jgi:hypothetical protein